MTKLYLAHNFSARAHLRTHVIPFLEQGGFKIHAEWVTDDSHLESFNDDRSARADLKDISESNGLVLFTDQYGSSHGKGKFLELGYALGKKIPCFLVGQDHSSCVFYKLSEIVHASDTQDLLRKLSRYYREL